MDKDNLTFEQAMKALEAIAEKMENGELSLDESIEAYTKGIELTKFCRSKLDAAEAKIQQLEADGSLTDRQ